MIILLLKKFKIKIGNILLNVLQKFVNQKDFLLNTVGNVTIAKKSYETFYNVVEKKFYLTMNKLSIGERDQTKDDFLKEKFWA